MLPISRDWWISKLQSISGLAVLTPECQPMRSLACSQENSSSTEMWPTKLHLQTSTTWLYYSIPSKSSKLKTLSSLDTTDAEESRQPLRSTTMDHFRPGCPTSVTWGKEIKRNWWVLTLSKTTKDWPSLMLYSKLLTLRECQLCSKPGKKDSR